MEAPYMNLQPLEDRIVVKPGQSEETTASGLVIPDTAKEKPQQGEVLAVGPGRRAESSGDLIPLDLAVGDTVVYSKYGGTEISSDGEDLLILSSRDVLAKVVKEWATKTNDVAGDGTTTATVLAQALIREGLRNVAAGANPLGLRKGIDKAVNAVVESIKEQSKEIDSKTEIAQVAAISAADAAIGEVLADAIDRVGKDGTVTVE